MALVSTNAGELKLLDDMLGVENFTLKLYKSNTTPTATSVIGDFTEADFTNYVSKTLTAATWNDSTTVSGKATATYGSSPLTWTCGATGNTIYGYTVQAATGGTLLWGELFASPRVLTDGEILNLTPTITLNSES